MGVGTRENVNVALLANSVAHWDRKMQMPTRLQRAPGQPLCEGTPFQCLSICFGPYVFLFYFKGIRSPPRHSHIFFCLSLMCFYYQPKKVVTTLLQRRALLIHNKNIEAPHVITNLLANTAGPVPLVLDLRVAHELQQQSTQWCRFHDLYC